MRIFGPRSKSRNHSSVTLYVNGSAPFEHMIGGRWSEEKRLVNRTFPHGEHFIKGGTRDITLISTPFIPSFFLRLEKEILQTIITHGKSFSRKYFTVNIVCKTIERRLEFEEQISINSLSHWRVERFHSRNDSDVTLNP